MSIPLSSFAKFLELKSCPVSSEWLRRWVAENPGSSPADCYTALLNTDLSLVGFFSLPNEIFPFKIKGLLKGTFVLQLVSIENIGLPFFGQLLEQQNQNVIDDEGTDGLDEHKFSAPSRRCLQLKLSDGQREISAMEFEPVPCLTMDMARGCKLKLKGPLELRRGILLLRKDSVEVLGGTNPTVDQKQIRLAEIENALQRTSTSASQGN